MNVCIAVTSCRMTTDGRVVLPVHIETQTGFTLDTEVEVNILSSSTVMNASIIDQVKGIIRDQGQTVIVTDNFKVFGGAAT